MSSLTILIPLVVVAWLFGLALIMGLCVISARSDSATRVAVRRYDSERKRMSRRERGGLVA
jgi:hypothetical protein